MGITGAQLRGYTLLGHRNSGTSLNPQILQLKVVAVEKLTGSEQSPGTPISSTWPGGWKKCSFFLICSSQQFFPVLPRGLWIVTDIYVPSWSSTGRNLQTCANVLPGDNPLSLCALDFCDQYEAFQEKEFAGVLPLDWRYHLVLSCCLLT